MRVFAFVVLVFLFIFFPKDSFALEKIIVVNTNNQTLQAIEGGNIVRQVFVSTGLPLSPTVKGDFRIYAKIPFQNMRGYSPYKGRYFLPNVPYVMYFFRGYGLHGTYWHNNFGRPMSNGCVNLPTYEAEWLYQWAPHGTLVKVV